MVLGWITSVAQLGQNCKLYLFVLFKFVNKLKANVDETQCHLHVMATPVIVLNGAEFRSGDNCISTILEFEAPTLPPSCIVVLVLNFPV